MASGNLSKIKNHWPGSRPCGMTSEELSRVYDPTAKQNGGQLKACLTHDYERDFILEAMLRDKVHQEEKQDAKKFNLRKTTKTQESRTRMNREKLRSFDKDSSVPQIRKAGEVSHYYPTVKVNKLLNRRNVKELDTGAQPAPDDLQ